MTEESLRTLWLSSRADDKEFLLTTIESVLDEDRSIRERERWIRVGSMIALGLLCPALIWCAAHGISALVRAAYALMAAGTATVVCAEWMYFTWSRQGLPGPVDTRSQLQTTAFLLARQAGLLKAGPLWGAPICLGAILIGVWIYQERSHAGGATLWLATGVAWLTVTIAGFAKGRTLEQRRSRIEQLVSDLG